jgi:hypothetical protein
MLQQLLGMVTRYREYVRLSEQGYDAVEKPWACGREGIQLRKDTSYDEHDTVVCAKAQDATDATRRTVVHRTTKSIF